MLDISFGELAVIFVVALVVLGPEKATETARNIGLWIGKIKRFISEVQYKYEHHINQAKEQVSEIQDDLTHSIMGVEDKHTDLYELYRKKKAKKPFKKKTTGNTIRTTLTKNKSRRTT